MTSNRIHDRALVLRRFEFGDTSLILHLFTREHGIVPVLAKGAQREKSPWRGALDLPAYIEAVWLSRPQREMQLLTEALLLEPFYGIRKNLGSFYLTIYAMELLEEAGQPAGSADLFELALSFLRTLNSGEGEHGTLWAAFELQFLTRIGLAPVLDHCASCGRSLGTGGRPRFDPASGGFLCGSCREGGGSGEAIPEAALRVAARLEAASWEQLPRVKVAPEILRQIRRALDGFLHYHWERMPRTRRQLDSLATSGR